MPTACGIVQNIPDWDPMRTGVCVIKYIRFMQTMVPPLMDEHSGAKQQECRAYQQDCLKSRTEWRGIRG